VLLELPWALPATTPINEAKHLHRASPFGEAEKLLYPLPPAHVIEISVLGRSLELDMVLDPVH
jgi:hypothetical protein